VTTPIAKAIGFSGHAFGNPIRYVPKAPSEPKSVLPLEAGTLAQKLYSLRHNAVAKLESAAKILPGHRLLTGTSRIFGCQEAFASQISLQSISRKGGTPDFLCPLKGAVPVW
jgi:hypothetical protein